MAAVKTTHCRISVAKASWPMSPSWLFDRALTSLQLGGGTSFWDCDQDERRAVHVGPHGWRHNSKKSRPDELTSGGEKFERRAVNVKTATC
jgi:hypothetical protein